MRQPPKLKDLYDRKLWLITELSQVNKDIETVEGICVKYQKKSDDGLKKPVIYDKEWTLFRKVEFVLTNTQMARASGIHQAIIDNEPGLSKAKKAKLGRDISSLLWRDTNKAKKSAFQVATGKGKNKLYRLNLDTLPY